MIIRLIYLGQINGMKVCNLIILITIFFTVGCENKTKYEEEISNRYKKIESAIPIEDLNHSIKHDDFRLYGIANNVLIIPLASDCLINEFGYKLLAGPSHASINYEQKKLNAIARVYVESYNYSLLVYLDDNNLSDCENIFKIESM